MPTSAEEAVVRKTILVRAPIDRAFSVFVEQMETWWPATHHIGSEVYYPLCLHEQAALAALGYKTGDFPESERAADEVLALPIYPELREDEQQTVVETIRRFYA